MLSIIMLAGLMLPLFMSWLPISEAASAASSSIQQLKIANGGFSIGDTHNIQLCVPVKGINNNSQIKNTALTFSIPGSGYNHQFYSSGSNHCFLSPTITQLLPTTQDPSSCTGSANLTVTITVTQGSLGAEAQVSPCGQIQTSNGIFLTTPAITLSSSKVNSTIPTVSFNVLYTTSSSCSGGHCKTQSVPQNSNVTACLISAADAKNSSTDNCNGKFYLIKPTTGGKSGQFSVYDVNPGTYYVQFNYYRNAQGLPPYYQVQASQAKLNLSKSTRFPITLILTQTGHVKPNGGGGGGGGGNNTTTSSCEASNFVLSWIVCGAIDLISHVEQSIESLISSLLQTSPFIFNANPNCTSTSASCTNQKISAATYDVWSNFRTYGDIVLVIALLIVVISEAAGGGLVDAYTVRKVLPRIIAAAILINLSIYIIAALEDIFNILGVGIINLIEAPFKSVAASLDLTTIHVSTGGGVVFTLGLVALATLPIIVSGIIGVLLLVVLMGLLAAIGVLITIAIRQGLIVFLLIISPVAFALYVLPNTERYFKQWWSLLIKTLAVYPIVMAIFGLSFISAIIMSNLVPNTGDQLLSDSMAILATVAPIFLIPFAFKMSGGIIGSIQKGISGLVANVNKPLGRRATARLGQGVQKTRAGQRFAHGTLENRRGTINRALQAATLVGAGKAGLNPTRWRQNVTSSRANLERTELEENMEKNQDYQLWRGDGALNRAASETNNEQELRARLTRDGYSGSRLDEAVSHVERVRKSMSAGAFNKMTTLSAVADGTAYGEAAEEDAAIARASGHNDAMMGWMVGRARTLNMQAGRIDKGAVAFSTKLDNVRDIRDELGVSGSVSPATERRVNEATYDSSIDSSNPPQVIYGKPLSARHEAEAHARRIKRLLNEASRVAADPNSTPEAVESAKREALQEMASVGGLYDSMGQAAPQNAREFADALMKMHVDLSSLPPDLRGALALSPDGRSSATATELPILSAMDNLRANNVEWAQMRHDIKTGIDSQLQGLRNTPPPGVSGLPTPPAGPSYP